MGVSNKKADRCSWRNTESTQNGISKSLGLPTLPSRRWSTMTYSSASDGSSDTMSNPINDDSEDDLEEPNQKSYKNIESESTNLKFIKALYVVLSTCFLKIIGGFGGPFAIIFTVVIAAVTFKAEQYRLEGRQINEQVQTQLAIENDIKKLLARLRSTKLITTTPQTNNIGLDRTVNHTLMIDTINQLRQHAETGALVRGSQEFRDFLLMERSVYGGCNYRSWDPTKADGGECWYCGAWE